jgi:hypothetical protein
MNTQRSRCLRWSGVMLSCMVKVVDIFSFFNHRSNLASIDQGGMADREGERVSEWVSGEMDWLKLRQ